jgi:hypothetical protein
VAEGVGVALAGGNVVGTGVAPAISPCVAVGGCVTLDGTDEPQPAPTSSTATIEAAHRPRGLVRWTWRDMGISFQRLGRRREPARGRGQGASRWTVVSAS